MTTADDKWDIDISPALAALKKLRAAIGLTDKKAAEGFDRSEAASKQARDELGRFVATGTTLGDSIGALANPLGIAIASVTALSAAFVTLAAVATQAFINITKEGIALNKEAEITKLSLTQIFEGNEKAADAFISTIGDLAIRLGTSRQELTGLAKGILPDVGSIGGTEQLLENVIVLGRDAGQSIQSIRIATEEALSGNLSSLGRRLNIPRKTLDSIEEYQKEMSLADAINKGLGERILETGISVDVTADSFSTLQGRIEGARENFKILLGTAPFEELKEQAQDFLVTLEKQGPEINFVAEAFGDLASNVIDFVGSGINEFIASIDFQKVEQLVDSFNGAVAAGQLLFDVLFDLPDTADGLTELTLVFEEIRFELVRLSQVAAKSKIVFTAAAKSLLLLNQLRKADVSGALKTLNDIQEDVATAEERTAAAAKNSTAAFERYEQRIKSIRDAQGERRDTTDDATSADLAAGDAILAERERLEELADAQAKAATAQEEISKKTAEAEAERQKKLTDIMRKEADTRFDDAVKAAQRREDIARKNVDALEDIFRKNEQAISAAAKDLSQEEQDIARSGGRDRKQIERDAANERVDIERNFRQELRRIQNQFNQDAADAERNNDAQAFIAAVRARDEQVQVATEDRDVSVEEAGINAERQRETLAVSLAAEVEDANIANARKLESLQTRLNQELEAQAIKVVREFEAETIKEQRLKEQRDLALRRQLEDFARTEAEKLAKLQESLAEQIALVEAAEQKQIEITAAAEGAKTSIVEAEAARRRAILGAQQEQRGAAARGRSALGGEKQFGAGGRPPIGEPVVVGDRGPEIFVPDRAGTIIPNDAIFSPPAQPSPAGASSMTSVTNNPTFNLAESMFKDPVARRQLTNFVLGVLAEGV